MENFNLGKMIAKFTYRVNNTNAGAKPANTSAQSFTPAQSSPSPFTGTSTNISPQMGTLNGGDRSVYIKDLMKLPRNMNELIFMLQKNLNQVQFNRMFDAQLAARKNLLSQTQAQILAQLDGLTTSEIQQVMKNQLNSQLSSSIKNLQLASGQMINLADISALIQTNGKDAVTKLILAMANASKQGVNDLSQLKETAKLINASIALASTDNPAQTLKTLMLLYLPWLPLQEGTDFDLEVEATEGGSEQESVLIITITTINYGTITATLILETQNSVHINIECSAEFPKDELLLRLQSEQKHYSMESVISFETKKNIPQHSQAESTQAKINMSHTNEISPYLLLAAHSLIRHTIELDRT